VDAGLDFSTCPPPAQRSSGSSADGAGSIIISVCRDFRRAVLGSWPMKALRLRTEIPEDRTLRLQLPDDVDEGTTEVVVLVSEPGSSGRDLFNELSTLPRRLWSRAEIEGLLKGDEVLAELVDKLRSRLGENLRQVILFGSRARGDHRPDSDFDCMVLVDALDASVEEAVDVVGGELLLERDAVFSIFPVTVERFRTETAEPLFRNVREDGVVLWKSRSGKSL